MNRMELDSLPRHHCPEHPATSVRNQTVREVRTLMRERLRELAVEAEEAGLREQDWLDLCRDVW